MKKQGGLLRRFGVFFLILELIIPGFLNWPDNLYAEINGVRINEIAWMGTTLNSSDEWIELFNISDSDIDLSGWKLIARDGSPEIYLNGQIEASEYFLLERTDDDTVIEVVANQIYSGALGNDGEYLELFDNNGVLIDYIDASGAWSAGNNVSKQTLSRSPDGEILSSLSAGGTPKSLNDYAETVESTPDEDGDLEEIRPEQSNDNDNINFDSEEIDGNIIHNKGDVVINEIVSDPSEGDEWIELLNVSGGNIDLKNWTIEEGSGAKTELSATMSASGEGRFFVLEKPKGNLNNSGDTIILRDNNGIFIDGLTYGDWNDGNAIDKAQVASDPNSLARIEKGKNSGNNNQDFVVTEEITKGKENIIKIPEINDDSDIQTNIGAEINVVISEIFPNPKSDEAKYEFVELYNAGDVDVDLLNWQIGDDKDNRYRIKTSRIIKSKEFIVLFRNETKIILNNNGGEINLYKANRKTALDKLKYEKAPSAKSLNCVDEEMFHLGKFANLACAWSDEPSPGKTNRIVVPNRAPSPDFSVDENLRVGNPVIFDSSDTFDCDGDEIVYEWSFGDGFRSSFQSPDHIYAKAGEYEVELKVSDEELSGSIKKKIKISALENVALNTNDLEIKVDWKNLHINQVLPNPKGSDDGEWIEIKNNGKEKVDLLNWQIDDKEGGSRPYIFKDSIKLSSDEVYLLSREDSGLALNNGGDAVRLIAPDNSLTDLVEYGKSFEGGIYSRQANNQWKWLSLSEDGEGQIILENKTSTAKVKISEAKNYKPISIMDINDTNIGESLKVSGVVSVLPGVFGSQYFYIFESNGLQIYSNKKDFPELKVGDLVEVEGELSLASGELRLKTKTKNDIVIISHDKGIDFKNSSCAGLDDENVGTPISLSGEIVKKQSGVIYLDDGSAETKLYVKPSTGIVLAKYEVGKKISVKGILTSSSSGRRLMPRSESDIVVQDDNEYKNENQPMVLGAEMDADEWEIQSNDKKKEWLKYIFFIVTAVIVSLIGYLLKRKKK